VKELAKMGTGLFERENESRALESFVREVEQRNNARDESAYDSRKNTSPTDLSRRLT
jgi:hypothetical protein